MDDADRRTFFACTSCTSTAVGVAFDVVGQSVVYYVRQVVNVQSTCGNISGNQELHVVVAELLHGEVALLLTQVAVQRFGIVSVANKLVGNFLRLDLGTAKDDGEDTWIEVYQTFQGQIFILGVHHIIYVVHLLGTLVATSYHNFLIVVKVVFGYLFNLAAHRCRKEQGVAIGRYAFENGVDALGKAHVQHLVGLV